MTDDLATRLERLYTGVLTDTMDRMGLPGRALPAGIAPLGPAQRVAGHAYVLAGRVAPGVERDRAARALLGALGAAPSGSLVVYATDAEPPCALFGELSATALRLRGCRGVIADGPTRDVEALLGMAFPVFCRGTSPLDALGRWEVAAHGGSAVVGDVTVATGDWLLADVDGVAVLPAARAEAIVAAAEAKVAAEDGVRDAIRSGATPLEAYDRYGVF